MDKLNLDLYVEQVNYATSNPICSNWEGNEERALCEVVDPNTEFKPKKNENRSPVSPNESYSLNLQNEETREVTHKRQQSNENSVVLQIEEGVLGGIDSRQKLMPNDISVIPQVHAYISHPHKYSINHTMEQEINVENDDNLQSKLYKYPRDRITVFSEKRGYLRHDRAVQEVANVTPRLKDSTMQTSPETATSMRSAESVTSLGEESKPQQRRDSIYSCGSVNSINSLGLVHDQSTTTVSATTTDQLMWAFRLARDRLDTASNMSGCSSRFELDSNCSEKVETISTISDVSGYEEEMYRIRRLLLLDSPTSSVDFKYASKFTEHCNKQNIKPTALFDISDKAKKLESHSTLEDSELQRNQRLSIQLQNALAEKENLRVQLAEIETKISLEWQEKYHKILRQKAHTEGRLEIVQGELEAISSERQNVLDNAKVLENEARTKSVTDGQALLQEMEKLTLECSTLQQLNRELEQQKQELSLQIELKDSELHHYREEIQELESTNERLRIDLQELRIEVESKDGSIQGLKEKVADQHVEFQLLYQAKLKAENSLTSCKNEMESIRNSGNWYRDQLHICQAAKLKVQQELMSSQANVVSHTHLVEKLKSKNAYLHQSVKDIQQRAVKEKELLMRKLEIIQADMMEREATILSQIHREDVTSEAVTSITAKLRKIEEDKDHQACVNNVLVKELEEQKDTLISELKNKETSLKNMESENSNLMMRVTTLQKTLNEKEILLQSFENKYRHLEMSFNQTNELLKCKEQTLLDVKNDKVTVEVALAAAKKEKVEVDMAVSKLREDFARLSKGYNTMKNEIKVKNKLFEVKEKEFEELTKEKQALKIDIDDLKKEKEEFRAWHTRIIKAEKIEKEVEYLKKQNSELQLKLSDLSEAQHYSQNTVSKLEEKLAFREQQLLSQSKNFEVFTEEQNTRDKKLMDENKNLAEVNDELKSKLAQAEANNVTLLRQLECYKSQVSRADGVINQFNELCRGSELEKHNLDKQLKKALKELEEVQIKSDVQMNSTGNFSVEESVGLVDKEIQVQSDREEKDSNIQSSLRMICELVERNLKKSVFLASNYKSSSINVREDTSKACYGDDVTFASISGRMTDLGNYLDKAIEERRLYLAELEKKQHTKDRLEFKVVRLKEEVNKRAPLDDRSSRVNFVKPLTKEGIDMHAEELSESDYHEKLKEKLLYYQKEIEKLKGLLRMTDVEHREKYRRYEKNVRTLLKKVKEHMRGRKVAEQTVEALQRKMESDALGDVATLQLEIKKLESELELSRRQYEEQKRIAEENQSTLLELEKERGKLVQSQDVLKEQRAMAASHEYQPPSMTIQFDQQARELQLQQLQRKVAELEQETSGQNKTIRDLKKKVFTEKCENSQLKKQLGSLKMGLDAANEMLDNKNIEVGRNETWRELLSRKHSDVQKMLELEQIAHEECREELVKIKAELEETRAKDPVLADQIKTLSYHLHQKTQEAAGLQEKFLLAEDRWSTVEGNLQQNVCLLQEEVSALRSELDSISRNKLLFQTQAAELKAALHSSLERNKMLKLKLEAYNCDSNEKLPDLTSSLPLPPTKYDEAQIAELLHQSAVLPDNKPLSNLQSCLDSLKQEMVTLQKQLTSNSSSCSFPASENIDSHKLDNYGVQNV
ncbi:golgin subfamily A member 3 [Anabrus simplex]|uniref:golgin subfamily A member 3 n=1 Tax=Anabrus simplex TaxID=316456 RepID=UPI0035A3D311